MIGSLESQLVEGFGEICACQFKYNYFFLFAFYIAIITVDEPTDLLPPYFEKKNIFPEHYKQLPNL